MAQPQQNYEIFGPPVDIPQHEVRLRLERRMAAEDPEAQRLFAQAKAREEVNRKNKARENRERLKRTVQKKRPIKQIKGQSKITNFMGPRPGPAAGPAGQGKRKQHGRGRQRKTKR